jgi:hypothetical protein
MMGGEAPAEEGAAPAGTAPSEDEAVQELAMALEELGIPPEALIGALRKAATKAVCLPRRPPEAAPKMAADKTASELNAIGARGRGL